LANFVLQHFDYTYFGNFLQEIHDINVMNLLKKITSHSIDSAFDGNSTFLEHRPTSLKDLVDVFSFYASQMETAVARINLLPIQSNHAIAIYRSWLPKDI